MAQQDFRARLGPKSMEAATDIIGENSSENLLFPLWQTRGVLFPYTISLSSGNVADYDPSTFIHTNYGYSAYIRSYPKPISISAEFTAQSKDEALYLLAVIHFFRSVTKSYFGISPYSKAGTPPPVLLFNYMGQYQYNNVPVIVKSFDFTYEANIDYVSVYTGSNIDYSENIGVSLPNGSNGGYTLVPTHINVKLELDTQYTPIKVRDTFNLDTFRSGKLITGGFI